MADNSQNQLPQLTATFLTQALSLDDDPSVLATELTQIERDDNTAVFAIRLDSSVGPAAFLIYTYDAEQKNFEGTTGRTRFQDDVKTLEEALRHDSPGPRMIANGEIGNWIFLLATDPATYRALAGAPEEQTLEATVADLPPTANTAELRREAAGELLRLLRDADAQASTWLAAVQAENAAQGAERTEAQQLEFDDVETELALFLLGGEGVSRLLQTMNLFIATAKQRAEAAGVPTTSTKTTRDSKSTD